MAEYRDINPPEFYAKIESKSDEWVRLNDIWNQYNVMRKDCLYYDKMDRYSAIGRLMRIIEFKMKNE